MSGNGEEDVVVVATGVGPVVRLRAENDAVTVEVVGLDKPWNMLVIAIIDKELAVVLEAGDVQFCDLVVVERIEVVEVLLVDVEQYGVVGRAFDELKLVGGELSYDNGLFGHLFDDVEEGDTDVSGQDGVFAGRLEYMVYERRCGAFPLGAGDADNLFVVSFEEEVCLRCDALGVNPVVDIIEADAGGFEDEVVLVEVLVIAGAFNEFQLFVGEIIGFEVGVCICHGERHVGKVFAYESVGGDALFAEAEDDYFFAFDGIDDIISGYHRLDFCGCKNTKKDASFWDASMSKTNVK